VRNRIASLIAMSIATCATPVFAQGANPSADQIIKSLTPTGDVSKTSTRGIRMAPQPGAADAPAPVTQAAPDPSRPAMHPTMAAAKPAAVPARSDAKPAVNLTVNFASGSAELTPQAIQALDALGTALSSEALSHYRFRVEGHTDTVGTPEANRALSARRAEAVVSYIETKFGVAATRLEPVGMGSDKPVIATAAQVDEPRNRRVQIVNLGG
jgi:outer membrane protein OmpA-like peptidoglycan-associated protein